MNQMEYQRALTFLNKQSDTFSKFMTRKWNEINDQPNSSYTKFTTNV